jgi:Ca2+-binding RTX toxin-like protein
MNFITPLEPRILLAGFSINGRSVTYTGGSKAEQFTLSPIPGTNQFIITAAAVSGQGGAIQEVMDGPVRQVRLNMRGGNDGAIVDTGGDRTTVIMNGGTGNDTLSVNVRGQCTLTGGDGKDQLSGGRGHDLLDGGPGDDHVSGSAGSDTLIGGTGYDVLWGGKGDDLLNGKDGAFDAFHAGPGADIARADAANSQQDPGDFLRRFKREFMEHAELEGVD